MYARADEEPVDPKRELEDRCKAPCTRPLKEYQTWLKLNIVERIGQVDRPALREFKVMNRDTNIVRDNTLITGTVLTIALLPSYFRILNNQLPDLISVFHHHALFSFLV
ncbi:hypothetical protein SASPL_118573 [Salvia splendens]|uniref:Uncharacterized protein n=1 Tax=Salvia splendens TaxID=180675 RepID=A0A8X8ZXC9_SALSN|nr:hypothetical protein SASPL_118573 [Salvia splendens]